MPILNFFLRKLHRLVLGLVRLIDAKGIDVAQLELVSKELNHLVAILHVYAGGLNFMK